MPIVIGGTGILACAVYLVQCEHKESVSRSHHDEKLITGWKPVLPFLIFSCSRISSYIAHCNW